MRLRFTLPSFLLLGCGGQRCCELWPYMVGSILVIDWRPEFGTKRLVAPCNLQPFLSRLITDSLVPCRSLLFARVFSKVLKLDNATDPGHGATELGRIVNLLASDVIQGEFHCFQPQALWGLSLVQLVGNAFTSLGEVWPHSPLLIVITVSLLYSVLGLASLVGVRQIHAQCQDITTDRFFLVRWSP